MSAKLEVFTSQSCPYCPMAVDAANEAKQVIGDDLEVEHLDVNENIDKVREYQILSVPTLILNGEVAFIGAPEADELIQKVRSVL